MTAQITFDQTGLPAGVPGRARTDGLDTGALVTISNGSGNPCRCELWWYPPDDSGVAASLTQVAPNQWTIQPTATTYGEYAVRMIEDEGTLNETEDIKIFGIRYPSSGLLITALNSRGDLTVNRASSTAQKTLAAQLSFNNEPLPDDPTIDYANWWQQQRELYSVVDATVDALANLDSDDVAIAPGISVPEVGSTVTEAIEWLADLRLQAISPTIASPTAVWSFTSTVSFPDITGNGHDLSIEAGTGNNAAVAAGYSGLWFDGTFRLFRNAADAAFRTPDNCSFVALCIPLAGFLGTVVSHEATGAAEAQNVLYRSAVTPLSYQHTMFTESGAGVGVTGTRTGNAMVPGHPMLYAWVREPASGGVVPTKFWFTRYVGAPDFSITTPTGGTDGRFRLGGGPATFLTGCIIVSAGFYNHALTTEESEEVFNFALGGFLGRWA